MNLNIIAGFIYPAALPAAEGSETVYVTDEQHAAILEDWNAAEPLAYSQKGEPTKLDSELRAKITEALNECPAMVAIKKVQKAHAKEQEKKRKESRKGIGQTKDPEAKDPVEEEKPSKPVKEKENKEPVRPRARVRTFSGRSS